MGTNDGDASLMKDAREEARERGVPLEVVLEEMRRAACSPAYPTRDCLSMEDHDDLLLCGIRASLGANVIIPGGTVSGRMQDLVGHLGACDFCHTALALRQRAR